MVPTTICLTWQSRVHLEKTAASSRHYLPHFGSILWSARATCSWWNALGQPLGHFEVPRFGIIMDLPADSVSGILRLLVLGTPYGLRIRSSYMKPKLGTADALFRRLLVPSGSLATSNDEGLKPIPFLICKSAFLSSNTTFPAISAKSCSSSGCVRHRCSDHTTCFALLRQYQPSASRHAAAPFYEWPSCKRPWPPF
jgi:hypothetical protein